MREPPSVLHVNTADDLGGAARSAYKIHLGLRALGLRSRMLVRTKATEDPDVERLDGGRRWRRVTERVLRTVVDPLGWQYLWYPSSSALPRHPWLAEADVVQLYNLHGGYFSFRVLPEVGRLKPLVWRLSDMWALTGHCAYSHDCDRWKTGCGVCPLLDEYPALWRDTTARLFRAKADAYGRCRLTIVATNGWMDSLVRASPLLARFPRRLIPNGVDAAVFRPRPKPEARAALGLPAGDPLVLFCAHVARPGTRKGGEHVMPALERVAAGGRRLRLAVLGEGSDAWPESRAFPTHRLPFVRDDTLLAGVYSAADLLLHPAVAENLPNTILEAMACGTPAVAFDTGGTRDAVRHLDTGFLAPRGETAALAAGVAELLDDEHLRDRLGRRSREAVTAEYTVERQAAAYRSLYEELVSPDPPSGKD